MPLFDWFRKKTRLQLAIARGLEKGNLASQIRELDDLVVSSRTDAEAICEALEMLLQGKLPSASGFDSPARCLPGLFQQIDGSDCEAAPILRHRGGALLIRLIDRALEPGQESLKEEVLFFAKILAMYATPKGLERIVQLAREGFESESWFWNVTLGMYMPGHPDAARLFEALRNPLPSGFIAISLLDAANQYLLKGGSLRHPFDSDAGMERLRAWIESPNEKQFSYAVSAVCALPFLRHAPTRELLRLAMQHPSADVRLEAAWAGAKGDDPAGIDALATMALDVNLSERACIYLRELNRQDAIPAAASSPEFAAKANFAQWLAHPNELSRPPETLTLVDHRRLRWPPDFLERPVWLLQYTMRDTTELEPDDVGVGMVGSRTWCFFSYEMEQRQPEDIYALHCVWELEERIEIHDVEASNREYDHLLTQWTGSPLQSTQIRHVAEVEPEIGLREKLIAIASAQRDKRPGWVVLDGLQSQWYPAADFPKDQRSKSVLEIHIGRQVLGFGSTHSRSEFLKEPAKLPAEQIVTAYERLLSRLATAPDEDRIPLLTSMGSPFTKHFDAYVGAVHEVRGTPENTVIISTYEKLLTIATALNTVSEGKTLGTFGPVGQKLDDYVTALIAADRNADVLRFVAELTPLWDNAPGRLGQAAFSAGGFEQAEALFLASREKSDYWAQGKEMPLLAEIWHRRGETERARELLLTCLRIMLEESHGATGSDIEFFENHYQRYREAFLRLLGPEESLEKYGLPESATR